MIKIILGLLFLFVPEIMAKQTYGNVIISEVLSIYDGDTFKVNIEGYPDLIGRNISIRLNGIDTPEIRGKCEAEKQLARAAKQFTVTKLRNAKVIELRNMDRGKYFRIVADVYVDGEELSKLLISNNHAVKYEGGTKYKSWCSQQEPAT